MSKPKLTGFTRLILKAIHQRKATRRTARLALLAGLGILVGCGIPKGGGTLDGPPPDRVVGPQQKAAANELGEQ